MKLNDLKVDMDYFHMDAKLYEKLKPTPLKNPKLVSFNKKAYDIKDSKIVASGTIEILDFAMNTPFLAFAKICEAYHESRSYSDVGIEFTLPYK